MIAIDDEGRSWRQLLNKIPETPIHMIGRIKKSLRVRFRLGKQLHFRWLQLLEGHVGIKRDREDTHGRAAGQRLERAMEHVSIAEANDARFESAVRKLLFEEEPIETQPLQHRPPIVKHRSVAVVKIGFEAVSFHESRS